MQNGTQQWDAGPVANSIALWDKDGSLIGGKGGFVLPSRLPALQPPVRRTHLGRGKVALTPPCRNLPGSSAVACHGVCYRTVLVAYPEPGFVPVHGGSRDTRAHRDFRYVSCSAQQSTVLRYGEKCATVYTVDCCSVMCCVTSCIVVPCLCGVLNNPEDISEASFS